MPAISPELVAEARRELARRDFWEFFVYLDPRALRGWWQRDAAARLQRFYERLVAGERPQLALCAPPQHGKSRLIVDFLAWLIGKDPSRKLIYASFSKRLGERANLRLQRIIDSPRYRELFPTPLLAAKAATVSLAKARRNSELLEFVDREGYFRNTTVLGSITGESLDLGVIDDPLKGREEAESQTIRDKTWDWFNDDFFTRFSDAAGLLIILTRWHLDDPLGRLLKAAEQGAADSGFDLSRLEVVVYKAIADEDEPHREAGEPLFPEFKSLAFLLGQKARMHPASWLSLYQQSPVPREGGIVKTEWWRNRFKKRGEKPTRVLVSWDCASKAKDRNDHSAYVAAAEFADRLELWKCEALRKEFPELLRWEKDVAAAFKPNVVLIEDKDAGQQLAQTLRRETKQPVLAIVPVGDKETRMMTETPIIEAGSVWLPDDEPWVADFLAEVCTFPQAPHDDRADALSQLLRYVREHPARRTIAAPIGVDKESNRGVGSY